MLAVIGKFKAVPNYVQVGEHLNKKVFNISTQLWKEMTPAQRWAATQKFLDSVIAQKGDFLLHRSIKSIGVTIRRIQEGIELHKPEGLRTEPGWLEYDQSRQREADTRIKACSVTIKTINRKELHNE